VPVLCTHQLVGTYLRACAGVGHPTVIDISFLRGSGQHSDRLCLLPLGRYPPSLLTLNLSWLFRVYHTTQLLSLAPSAHIGAVSQSQPKRTKTVAVLGTSYGGISAVQILEKGLPKGWQMVLVDRNRYVVLPLSANGPRALKVSYLATRIISFISYLGQLAAFAHVSNKIFTSFLALPSSPDMSTRLVSQPFTHFHSHVR
jgi:hypothetical protein